MTPSWEYHQILPLPLGVKVALGSSCNVFRDRPVTELAEELGLSHAVISQQRAEGIRLLREALQARGIPKRNG